MSEKWEAIDAAADAAEDAIIRRLQPTLHAKWATGWPMPGSGTSEY